MGVTIGGDADKSGKSTHLLVVMSARLLQKMGLINLTNRTRFKKGNGYKIRTKSVRNYCGIRLMLHMRSIYCWYTNVKLLGVWGRSYGLWTPSLIFLHDSISENQSTTLILSVFQKFGKRPFFA